MTRSPQIRRVCVITNYNIEMELDVAKGGARPNCACHHPSREAPASEPDSPLSMNLTRPLAYVLVRLEGPKTKTVILLEPEGVPIVPRRTRFQIPQPGEKASRDRRNSCHSLQHTHISTTAYREKYTIRTRKHSDTIEQRTGTIQCLRRA